MTDQPLLDVDGFYHPLVNKRGTDQATDTVGYECRRDNTGRVAIFNGITGKQLTDWRSKYCQALLELKVKEKRAWNLTNYKEVLERLKLL
jgi:hypothetical protein